MPRPEISAITEADAARRYLPVVRRIAGRICARFPSSVRVDDLVQEGMIGLIQTLRANGVADLPPTYLTIRVRGAMLDSIRRQYPRALGDRVKRIRRAALGLSEDASHIEIAAAAGMSERQYHGNLVDFAAYRSMAEGHAHEGYAPEAVSAGGDPLADIIRAEDDRRLAEAIECLPDRERYVVAQTYHHGRSLMSVARELRMSESRACQIRNRAINTVVSQFDCKRGCGV